MAQWAFNENSASKSPYPSVPEPIDTQRYALDTLKDTQLWSGQDTPRYKTIDTHIRQLRDLISESLHGRRNPAAFGSLLNSNSKPSRRATIRQARAPRVQHPTPLNDSAARPHEADVAG